jgi:hypothetical protein
MKVYHPNGNIAAIGFICPGCGSHHQVPVDNPDSWTWNGDANSPTVNPSLLATSDRWDKEQQRWVEARRCHSFIRDGFIQFLADCNHDKANQTIELPHLSEETLLVYGTNRNN